MALIVVSPSPDALPVAISSPPARRSRNELFAASRPFGEGERDNRRRRGQDLAVLGHRLLELRVAEDRSCGDEAEQQARDQGGEEAANGRRVAVTGRAGCSGKGVHGIRVYRRAGIFAVHGRRTGSGRRLSPQEVIVTALPSSPSVSRIVMSGGPADDQYVPGVCNIGAWEIRRRRRFAYLGFAVAVILFGVLVAVGAPAWTRLLVFLPLASGTFSWLQARRRFCAGFAVARVSNFADGEDGRRRVEDEAAHRADISAVRRMTRDSILIALPIAILAALLPV